MDAVLEENNVPNPQTASPESSSEGNDKDKVQASESKTEESGTNTLETTVLVEHFEHIETQLDTLTVIGVVIVVALGLIFGGFSCKSFFDFMR